MSVYTKPIIIWRFTDGRGGHDAQSLGLTTALSAITSCRFEHITIPTLSQTAAGILFRKFKTETNLPDPQLLIGAGHKTHLPLLSARRARGGKSIVIMRPSLPYQCFDLCLIPEHDNPPDRINIIRTRGALNTIGSRPQKKVANKGLILIGGPSRHYGWDNDRLLQDINSIINSAPGNHWTIADSPRTPDITRTSLIQLVNTKLDYRPYANTPQDWLANEIVTAPVIWVTTDSVSMIYEALTAGAMVGLIELEEIHNNSLTRSIRHLASDGLLTPFNKWKAGHKLTPANLQLNESARCAQLVLKYFSHTLQSTR